VPAGRAKPAPRVLARELIAKPDRHLQEPDCAVPAARDCALQFASVSESKKQHDAVIATGDAAMACVASV